VKDAGGRFLTVASLDQTEFKEVGERKVLESFVSQALRDDRKKSKDKKPPVMQLSLKMWNLSIWSNLARQIFDALMDDDIDSTNAAKQIFDKFLSDINRGLVPCDNGGNDTREKQLDTKVGTDTADNVEQKLHPREELTTIVDMKITDRTDRKEKLEEIHRRSFIHCQDPNWAHKLLSDIDTEKARAAGTLMSLFKKECTDTVQHAEG